MRIYPIAITAYRPKQQNQQHIGYQTLPEMDTLSFEARVDKGMDRFYSTNETRMPQTVIDYVATLDDKTKLTPLETQQEAFELLKIADNAEDIKGAYPDEELFKTLIDPQQSKARRGIVKLYNDFAQDLQAENKDILKSKENFTVYLVKKVFLENKTIDEINKDLETDLEPDFKALFHTGAGDDARYVHPTTLSTLGIQTPHREYRQSLRYTKDGYSDTVGEKISAGQIEFWKNLPEEARNARTKNSTPPTRTMTEEEKEQRQIKMTERWKSMSAAERTDYISRMKAGTEPQRYAMIDAWNNSTDVIKALSSHLKENQIYKTADMLYSNQEFSQFQSQVMSEFWGTHPDLAMQLGERIQTSNEKVKAAISNGTFDELKRQILDNKNQRIKELEAFKAASMVTEQATPRPKDYLQEFRQAYLAEPHAAAQMKNMPQAYVEDYFKAVGEGYDQKSIEAWTKNLRGEHISNEELDLLRNIMQTEPPCATRMSRAIEASLAQVLYENTNNPEVFRFSHSDCKTAIAQIARGEKAIHIVSQKNNEEFMMPLTKRKIDKAKIANLYHAYKADLDEDEVYRIAHSFFETTNGDTSALEEYISSYGKSANIIFSDRSVLPNPVKERFYQKFKNNMPAALKESVKCFFDRFSDPFGRETRIRKINFSLAKRFDFVPQMLMEKFQDEIGRVLRKCGNNDLFEEFETKVCPKRQSINSTSRLVILPKDGFTPSNALRLLAGEQVLAEALYDSTKNPEVFAMQFEELCDNIELFNMAKKFPSESRTYHSTSLDKEITLTAMSKPDVKSLKSEYIACTNDVTDLWLNSEVKTHGFGKLKTLIDILANGENDSKILDAIAKRINKYKLKLR